MNIHGARGDTRQRDQQPCFFPGSSSVLSHLLDRATYEVWGKDAMAAAGPVRRPTSGRRQYIYSTCCRTCGRLGHLLAVWHALCLHCSRSDFNSLFKATPNISSILQSVTTPINIARLFRACHDGFAYGWKALIGMPSNPSPSKGLLPSVLLLPSPAIASWLQERLLTVTLQKLVSITQQLVVSSH